MYQAYCASFLSSSPKKNRVLLPARQADDRVPLALFVWTWASSVLANLAFFGRPGVALAGGLAMAVVAVPLVRRR